MIKIVFACCFCGEDVEAPNGKGVALSNLEDGEFEQQWWVHLNCFLDKLTPVARDSYAYDFVDLEEQAEERRTRNG